MQHKHNYKSPLDTNSQFDNIIFYFALYLLKLSNYPYGVILGIGSIILGSVLIYGLYLFINSLFKSKSHNPKFSSTS